MKEILDGIKNKTEQATKNPGARFGMLYIYIAIIVLLIGIYYVNNLENISRQKIPPVIPDTTIVTDLIFKNALNVPPINITEVNNSTPELIAEGEKLYKTNCSSCHGENGAGGGPASMGLNPAPRNFTSKDNWKNGTKISGIYTTLQEGLLPSSMIAYDFLLPKQKFAIAHYLRTTFIPDPESDSDIELKGLDATYNLSAGLTLAAQIPVKSAGLLLATENEGAVSKIEFAQTTLKNFTNDPGFKILNKVVSDSKTAFSLLSGNSEWKQNKNEFINLIVNNVNTNGFNSKIFSLNSSDWVSLHSIMLKLI